eukprot:963080_1
MDYARTPWWGNHDGEMMDDTSIRQFNISVSDEMLDDLNSRLQKSRFPKKNQASASNNWEYGFSLKYIVELRDHWINNYDWRLEEERLNSIPQFATDIDGLIIHFLHVKSHCDNAVPLLLCHGWPGSVFEFFDIIPLLIEKGFDIIAPSIPGFGWSSAPQKAGYNVVQTAVTFSKLMSRLGYSKYIAQGGDWGSMIVSALALVDPRNVSGIHLNMT